MALEIHLAEHIDNICLSLLKYEDFDKSIETIFNALDLEKPDTKIKVNKHKIEEKINRESRALINNIFDKDFKEYNYRKRNRYSAKY